MDGLLTAWNNRTAQQWIEEAGRFEKMAEKFDRHAQLNASFKALARDARARAVRSPVRTVQSVADFDRSRIRRIEMQSTGASDLDYFRMRAAKEQTAASNACDMRVRRVHLEMAERYQALVSVAEVVSPARMLLVS